MKTLIIASAITAALASTTTEELTGTWESRSETGMITGVVFKPGNNFEGYINNDPFVSRTYTYSSEDSIFSFTDNTCNGVIGTYKIKFFSNGDSMRFTAIDDGCNARKETIEELNMGKVK